MYSRNTHQGRYAVQNTDKYVGNVRDVFYRSMWELKFMKWCDSNPAVLQWGSEEIVIPYLSPVDGRVHRYFVDFFIKLRNRRGEEQRYLIEIKPKKFTEPPKRPTRQTRRYVQEAVNYAINQSKWEHAQRFCEKHGLKFLVLTEHELGIDK
jgi:hypothetical protein